MKQSTSRSGFTLIEVLVAMGIMSVVFALGIFYWQGRLNQNALRYGTFQVSSDIRQAQELAKSQRYQYTVAFTSGAPTYTVSCPLPCSYNRTIQLPSKVTTNTVSVVWSGFGQPSSAYTVSVQNVAGTATVTVDIMGGITYQLP
jgi:prepilin-type N-terminal cleavage/methylation domain-containing protein